MIVKGLILVGLIAVAVLAIAARVTHQVRSASFNCYENGPGPATPTVC